MPSICITDRIIGKGSSPNLQPAKTTVLMSSSFVGQRDFIYGFSAESFVSLCMALKYSFLFAHPVLDAITAILPRPYGPSCGDGLHYATESRTDGRKAAATQSWDMADSSLKKPIRSRRMGVGAVSSCDS